MFKLALICGGPSEERGISLNSARSVLDHLSSHQVEVIPFYVDANKKNYVISSKELYSNTPLDFDYKLSQVAKALTDEEFYRHLQEVDLVFPLIHGSFGDDGQVQGLLEKRNIPFVGCGKQSCEKMYFKDVMKKTLQEFQFPVLPFEVLSADKDCQSLIEAFFQKHRLKRAVIKPCAGGSSIGVFSVATKEEAFEKCQYLFKKGKQNVLLEVFCEGKEFTVVVLEKGALTPTEIEMDYGKEEIFDYRRKYLPTNQAVYHTPPRFSPDVIHEIRYLAKKLFSLFKMQDFARLDGWVMPDNTLYFTDLNPLSGLEQNSFLFRQASIDGMTHRQILEAIVQSACRRYNLSFPSEIKKKQRSLKPVYVLFGGKGPERQVSLMSGTNVWLKLLGSKHYLPIPFFYDKEGSVWQIPYSVALNHTVEEVYENCLAKQEKKLSLEEFLEKAKKTSSFVFIALHGGIGENGVLQKYLETKNIAHNGSDSITSSLCMDKYLTANTIRKLNHPDILTSSQKLLSECDPFQENYPLVVKPRSEGCSSGIVVLRTPQDLKRYLTFVREKASFIPKGTFSNQLELVEMFPATEEYLLEPYVEVDQITFLKNQFKIVPKTGWIELTVGVLEKQGKYQVFNPSISVADGSVLSLEEKFQGGTGVNLTPPPLEIISLQARDKIKELVAIVCKTLGIRNYARIDLFYHRIQEKILVIEANTLPGLTPSTVFYHQGLAEEPPLPPLTLLETIISNV